MSATYGNNYHVSKRSTPLLRPSITASPRVSPYFIGVGRQPNTVSSPYPVDKLTCPPLHKQCVWLRSLMISYNHIFNRSDLYNAFGASNGNRTHISALARPHNNLYTIPAYVSQGTKLLCGFEPQTPSSYVGMLPITPDRE